MNGKFLIAGLGLWYFLRQKEKITLTKEPLHAEAQATYKSTEQALIENTKPAVETIKNIIAPPANAYTISPSKLPAYPPSMDEFPLPNAVKPLPLLLWSLEAQRWVAECPATGSALMMDSSGKQYTVAASCPMVSWVDNGVPRMEPNIIHKMSTRPVLSF